MSSDPIDTANRLADHADRLTNDGHYATAVLVIDDAEQIVNAYEAGDDTTAAALAAAATTRYL